MAAVDEMHRYAYWVALVGDRYEYVSTAPQGPYAIYYEAELRRIAEGQPVADRPPQPVAGRHFVERHPPRLRATSRKLQRGRGVGA